MCEDKVIDLAAFRAKTSESQRLIHSVSRGVPTVRFTPCPCGEHAVLDLGEDDLWWVDPALMSLLLVQGAKALAALVGVAGAKALMDRAMDEWEGF